MSLNVCESTCICGANTVDRGICTLVLVISAVEWSSRSLKLVACGVMCKSFCVWWVGIELTVTMNAVDGLHAPTTPRALCVLFEETADLNIQSAIECSWARR